MLKMIFFNTRNFERVCSRFRGRWCGSQMTRISITPAVFPVFSSLFLVNAVVRYIQY